MLRRFRPKGAAEGERKLEHVPMLGLYKGVWLRTLSRQYMFCLILSRPTLIRAQLRWPSERMRSGSSIRKCQACLQASTMSS